jgi:ATP-binding cassette, subfamily G (WHITE), member 2, PDR
MCSYLVATELNASHTYSSAGALTFKRGKSTSAHKHKLSTTDKVEYSATKTPVTSPRDKKTNSRMFNWSNVTYDIPVKGAPEPRRLLNDVSGWVEPGTLTALMGSSGAGKTTLLDVLAKRTNVGVVGGTCNINGEGLGTSFQRDTGYVQQQDLHLSTSTVREALRFSAALRQPRSVPVHEKYAYVEEVIDKLGMGSYGDALVGDSDLGEGLNVEQRKMLSIGVELVAKPSLLLFLDEPTSGLDSQSAYSIVCLLRTLTNEGQAILATIHQPSAVLFEQFDRLLFMAAGGKTIYFGDLGKNSRVLLDYFERQGARHCDDHENPAEYMLEIVGAKTLDQDWHEVWKRSAEKQKIEERIVEIRSWPPHELYSNDTTREFAASFGQQLRLVTIRIFQQYWRSPTYIISKLALAILSSL